VKVQGLSVSHAFHSALMEPMLGEFERVARGKGSRPTRCRLISNVTGEAFVEGKGPDGEYWRRHVREPVQFEKGMRALAAAGVTVFVELGPQPTLTGMARLFLASPQAEGDEQAWVGALSRDVDDTRRMMESVAALHAHGVDLDWSRFHERRPARKTLIPSYPFERKRYWIEPSKARQTATRKASQGHPLLGQRMASALPIAQFEALLGAESPAYLSGHRIYGLPVFPATGYVELILAALRAVVGDRPCELEDVRIERAMILPEGGGLRRVQVLLSPVPEKGNEARFHFDVYSQPYEEGEGASPWLLHARGEALCDAVGQTLPPPPYESAASALAGFEGEDEVTAAEYYRLLSERGLGYSGAFQPLTLIRRGPHGSGTAFARAALSAAEGERPVPPEARHIVHPALLDGCLQAIGAALTTRFAAGNAIRMAYVPVSLQRVRLRRPIGAEVSSHAQVRLDSKGLEYSADLCVFDADGAPALEIVGLRMQGVERSRLREASSERQHGADILHQLTEASPAERWGLMVAFISSQVADIMGLERDELDSGLMYFELGMSSLGSVELQYRLQKNLRCELPKNLIVDYESTETLAAHLLTLVFGQGSFQRGQS
jgi:acyl transferase domain-containing protein